MIVCDVLKICSGGIDKWTYFSKVDKAITILQDSGINRCTWYVLVGYNTIFSEDLERCNYLKSRGQNVFVQRYETCHDITQYSLLARWANQHHIFQTYSWEKFINHPKHKRQAMRSGLLEAIETNVPVKEQRKGQLALFGE